MMVGTRTSSGRNADALLDEQNPPKPWKIDENTAREIRALAQTGKTRRQIAEDTGVSTSTVYRVLQAQRKAKARAFAAPGRTAQVAKNPFIKKLSTEDVNKLTTPKPRSKYADIYDSFTALKPGEGLRIELIQGNVDYKQLYGALYSRFGKNKFRSVYNGETYIVIVKV